MSLGHGASVVRDGLVFHMDMGNVNKSWKGKPTTNLVPDPDFTQQIWDTWSGRGADSWGYTTFDHSTCAYTDLSINTGERRQLYRDITVSSSLTTFALSIEAYVTSDCDATSVFANQEYPFGNNYGSQSYDLSKKGSWQKLYAIRDNAYSGNTGNVETRYRFYFGTTNTTGTKGKIYFRKAQLEVGDFATPFVNGTRSNTEAIIDLAGIQTATAESLTYDSDGTFSLYSDGGVGVAGDYISCGDPDSLNFGTGPFSLEFVTYKTANGYQGGSYVSKGNGTSLGFDFRDSSFYVHGSSGLIASISFSAGSNVWQHHSFVFDPTSSPYITYYRNGDQISTSSTNNSGNLSSINTTRNLDIGRSQAGGVNRYFNGQMPIVKIYNKSLTATEVKRNFNAIRGRYGI